jgi:hypothetical protein
MLQACMYGSIGIILKKIRENLVNYPLTSNLKPDLPQKNTLN